MSESRNPYIQEDGKPVLQKSVVAFIDILGYKEMVAAAVKDGKSQELLGRLHEALREAREYVDPDGPKGLTRTPQEKDFSAFCAFTDNIVIGYPVEDDAEAELFCAFSDLSFFQSMMSMDGFFVRGGIAVGDLYMDDITVYGEGLVEAYKAESELARDPRIVLAPSAKIAVDQHLEYYGRGSYAPQNSDLLKDVDGQYFLDYMMGGFIKKLVEKTASARIAVGRHRNSIEARLREFADRPAIWSKYLWVANYHNYCCEQFPAMEGCKIDMGNFVLKPARLME